METKYKSIKELFRHVQELIKVLVDVFMISESRLHDSFTKSQFFVDDHHTPFQYDGNLLQFGEDRHIHCDFPTAEPKVPVEINGN